MSPLVPEGERGSATLLTVAAAGVVAVVLAAVLLVAGTVRDVHRARGAADLAALAAAVPLAAGAPADCGWAAQVARANGGTMTACAPQDGSDVVVSVSVTRPAASGWLAGLGGPAVVVASARAGVTQARLP